MRIGASRSRSAGLSCSAALLLLLASAGAPGSDAWSWPWSRHASVHSSSVAPKTRMEDGSILMEWRSKPPAGSHAHRSIDPANMRCQLDPKVNPSTILNFRTEIGEMWGSACGRNRGVFVLDPPDGNTYDCGHMPADWGVADAGSLLTATPTKAVYALGEYISAVYNSTIVKGVAACDFNGLAYLTCGREEPWKKVPWYSKIKNPIRAVNIGGLFVLEQWILPGFVQWGETTGIWDQYTFSSKCGKMGNCQKLKDHWKQWYTPADFKQMKEFGLNTIRLPVGYWYFAEKAGLDPSPYLTPDEDLYDAHHPITNVIRWANEAGLQVILDLHGAPFSQNGLDNSGRMSEDPDVHNWGETWLYNEQAISETVKILEGMALYVKYLQENLRLDNIMMLELVNEPWVFLDMGMVRDFYILAISSIRAVLPNLPILLHDSFHGDMWAMMLKYFPYDNIYMDTHIYHGFNPSDIASNSYEADKLKMYVHERMSCAMTSMLRYETCSAAPTLTGEWSLAIDNCMDAIDRKFQDYGQCDRIAMRSKDPWWKDHIKSFAHRQMDVYERELGWAFWAYKLDDHAETTALSAPLWSFRLAVKNGYIDTTYPKDACKHNPIADWQGGIASVTSEGPIADMAEEENAPAAVEGAAADAVTEQAAAEKEGLEAHQEAKVVEQPVAEEEAAEEEEEEEEEEDVVLAAAAPEEAKAEEEPKKLSANFGGVLLGLCGLAALLACAVLVSQLVAARSNGEAGPRIALPAFPAAISRIVRRTDYETVAEEQDPSVVAGIRV